MDRNGFSGWFSGTQAVRFTSAPPMKVPAKLDATDLKILAVLQDDASLTNQALAARVHTSPATCLRRVKALVDGGVIERRVALLSSHALDHGLTAFVEVSLERQGA